MVDNLRYVQSLLGPVGSFLLPLIAGFAGGIGLTSLLHRRETTAAPPVPEPESEAETDSVETDGKKKDNRRLPRRSGRPLEVLVALPGETDFPKTGVVLNRSVGGLCLLLRKEYNVGTILGVFPSGGNQLTPWTETQVKSCRKHGAEFEVGVQFVKVPPYATLVMFG